MTDELRNTLAEEEAILYPDLERALIGCTMGFNTRAVYDFDACIRIRMEEGASYEDAIDDLHFNTLGQYVGEKTPVFVVLTENNNDIQCHSPKDKAATHTDDQRA